MVASELSILESIPVVLLPVADIDAELGCDDEPLLDDVGDADEVELPWS